MPLDRVLQEHVREIATQEVRDFARKLLDELDKQERRPDGNDLRTVHRSVERAVTRYEEGALDG